MPETIPPISTSTRHSMLVKSTSQRIHTMDYVSNEGDKLNDDQSTMTPFQSSMWPCDSATQRPSRSHVTGCYWQHQPAAHKSRTQGLDVSAITFQYAFTCWQRTQPRMARLTVAANAPIHKMATVHPRPFISGNMTAMVIIYLETRKK